MSQETITLRLSTKNWELFNKIAFLAKNGHRTNQAVIESLLRLGMEQLELAEQQIRAKSNDPYVVSILESDVLGTSMRCMGRNASGKIADDGPSKGGHCCQMLQCAHCQEVKQ